MAAIPDFNSIPFAPSPEPPRAAPRAWTSPEGIAIKSIYDASDLDGLGFLDTWPGLPPYLRGPYPTMYVKQPWTVRQYAGFSTAEEFNAFYRAQSRRRAEGPVGRLRSRHPSRLRFRPSARRRRRRHGGRRDRLDLRHAHAVLRHSARPDERVDDDERRGAAGAGALHRRGGGAGRAAGEARRARSRTTSSKNSWCATPTSIRPRPRCASSPTSSPTPRSTCRSSTRSRSPAITCRRPARRRTSSSPTRSPTASNICAPASRRASTIDEFAPRLSFFWAIGMNFFMEVAKLRAARLLWAKLVEAFDPKIARIAVAAHPLPDLGLVADRAGRRSTTSSAPQIEAMAATQGHTQSLHTNALDEALALPTDFSARIARNTQLFLQQESGTTRVIDPWGGSYLCRAADRRSRGAGARAHIDEVEALGGMAKAIEARPAEAAHRGGRRAHPGAHRLRPADGDRRQQVPAARRGADRRAQGRQRRRCAQQQIDKLERLRAERDRSGDAGRARRADRSARAAATAICWRSPSTRRAPRRPSARSRWRWRRCSAAIAPRSRRSPASTSGRSGDDATPSSGVQRMSPSLRRERRPPPAHPGRQDRPGRPRPRPEGDRLGLRRPRLRRRHRPAVRDARGSRAPGGRERRRTSSASPRSPPAISTLVPELQGGARQAKAAATS